MFRAGLLALVFGLVALSTDLTGQDKKPSDPPGKFKGVLPPNWKKIGLTDTQVQEVYKVQGKYNDEIDKLEAKIKELKSTRDKEMKAVLTAEQKKRLDDILTGKDK
jgi:Spy/CpxP family protein refolding chaperone